MSLGRYSALRQSGVDVIGAIPVHWEVRPLRHIGRLLKGVGGSKEDVAPEGVPCVRYGDLYTTHAEAIDRARTFLTEDRAAAYTPIKYGDVLFAASGEKIEEIGKSAVNLIRGDARCGGDMIVLRPSVPMAPRFLGYAADASPSVAQKTCMGRGTTVKHIYPDELRNLMVAVPPVAEQQAIADFLDRKTAAIDDLISKKERLVVLLAEKRQALITEAVTKGLDSSVPMKASGVEWIGEVPKHWTVSRFKHLMADVVDCPHSTPDYDEEGTFPAIRTADIERGRLSLDRARRVTATVYFERVARAVPRAGDILYSREGERFGIAALVPPDVLLCMAQRMMMFRPHAGNSPAFLMWSLNAESTFQQVRQDTIGATAPRINIPTIKDAWLAHPPPAEQRLVADAIDTHLQRVDRTDEMLARQIDRLREYRQALINAAVTGKLDVTAPAARDDATLAQMESAP